MHSVILFVVQGLLGPTGGAGGQESLKADVVKELKAYYSDNKPPPFEAAITLHVFFRMRSAHFHGSVRLST